LRCWHLGESFGMASQDRCCSRTCMRRPRLRVRACAAPRHTTASYRGYNVCLRACCLRLQWDRLPLHTCLAVPRLPLASSTAPYPISTLTFCPSYLSCSPGIPGVPPGIRTCLCVAGVAARLTATASTVLATACWRAYACLLRLRSVLFLSRCATAGDTFSATCLPLHVYCATFLPSATLRRAPPSGVPSVLDASLQSLPSLLPSFLLRCTR